MTRRTRIATMGILISAATLLPSAAHAIRWQPQPSTPEMRSVIVDRINQTKEGRAALHLAEWAAQGGGIALLGP